MTTTGIKLFLAFYFFNQILYLLSLQTFCCHQLERQPMNADFSECEGQYCHKLPTSQHLIFLSVINKQNQKLDHLTSLMKLSNTCTTITEILWFLVCVELSTKYLFAVIGHISNCNKVGLGSSGINGGTQRSWRSFPT